MMSLQQLNRIVSLPYALLMTAAKHVKVIGLVRILTQTTLDAAPAMGTMHENHMLPEASLWTNAAAANCSGHFSCYAWRTSMTAITIGSYSCFPFYSCFKDK
jgi:hypothetical protein